MEEGKRLTHVQYAFLRELRNHRDGLPQALWPRTSTLKRWLRKPRFKAAMKALRETMQFEADLMLAGSSARAAKSLQDLLATKAAEEETVDTDKRSASLLRVIRAEHLRQKETRRRPRQPKREKARTLQEELDLREIQMRRYNSQLGKDQAA